MPETSRARRMIFALATALLGALIAAPIASAASQPPAGGSGLDQVAIATGGATVATAILLWICISHRNGRIKWVGKLAGFAERETGVAGWSSLPGAMLGISLLTAVFGMYWDISLHIDNGRDPGPLANPAHYFILAGLFGVLAAGVLSVALTPEEKPSKAAIRLPNGWWAPLGAVMVITCGAVSLLAFPLDDIWHRLFGQDVTLWGPTHLLLIGGASFSILGQWVLDVEGHRASKGRARQGSPFVYVRNVSLVGSLLVGLSTFQAEFDFSVPQFRLVWQPLLLALAAGMGLVAARVRLGRGGAVAAALFFIGLRGLLSLLVGPIFGETTPHFPLYIVEAGLVEIVALRWGRERPIALGAVSGVLIGTIGFAAEYAWANIVDTIGWPSSLIVEGVICALVAGIAGGIIGGWIGRSVTPGVAKESVPRWAVPAAGVAAVAVIAWAIPMPNGTPPKATLTLAPAKPLSNGEKQVLVTAKLDPPNAADKNRWFVVTAWQGKRRSVVGDMKKIGPGLWRADKPVPVGGTDWKATLRLQRGSAVLGIPLYLPEDKAIPVKKVAAKNGATQEFVRDKSLLQREQKKGIPGFLTLLAYIAVFLIWAAMVAVVAWGLARLAGALGSSPPSEPPAERSHPAATPAGVQPTTA
ncbi:MAG: hypothetical protein QOF65_19 [Thermoleophilaceae bacterium]|jgi:hypothetical protein|nr:hypothetical protein [Thermoleophilaceae bacterium]MEA2435463.1 hypothetical protein [Thermoleophilaceae bacterium]